ncbi:nuclear protein involved in pre-rRNA processing, putative [Talaromyces stipitatus ATCC 10500]|uniref:rRNA-processing protein EFG1 n=1 Tax=Talaromyces stipitatus (strain ATCC 10500 / CBS 375.48 / QM 6759 / NRRL 1006) TaxID=441959 RepID=B8M6T0_TALSN|nr:nuclear protein involved in pre-rRNA processing, putative [Talaromyces stipitatus ATCC 10500]EED20150.1 nuclear protein involved in pre-rRNA processing, putative [Talaromyces stipitatus ATCC 10500]
MSSKEGPARFHPYDTSKKPKIHRSNTSNTENTTGSKRNHNASTTQKQPANKNSTGDKGLSINDLKKRIRDVKRLLTRVEHLSPEARIVQERALKGYERDLEQEQARRQRSEMIKKYHFVRFLDRKTATKQLRTAQREYGKTKQQQEETGTVDNTKLATLQKQIDIAQIDVNYTIYYPLTEKYISLYPQEKKRRVVKDHNENAANGDDNAIEIDEEMQTSEDDTGNGKEEGKPPMWDIIKKCMAEKTLDQLRDGKLNIGFDGKPIQKLDTATVTNVSTSIGANEVKKKKEEKTETRKEDDKKKNKRKRKEVEVEERKEDEDSDGGFFEE